MPISATKFESLELQGVGRSFGGVDALVDLDLTVRADSELTDTRFDNLPKTGSVIGAIIRDGSAIFPGGNDVLRAGDRVIVFVESRRASLVERVL